jgi:hypothetical protein
MRDPPRNATLMILTGSSCPKRASNTIDAIIAVVGTENASKSATFIGLINIAIHYIFSIR